MLTVNSTVHERDKKNYWAKENAQNDDVHRRSFRGGLAPRQKTLGRGQDFALILFKLHEIW